MTIAVQAVFIGGPLDLSRLTLDGASATYEFAQCLPPPSGIGESAPPDFFVPGYYLAIYRRATLENFDSQRVVVYVFDERQTEQNRRRASQPSVALTEQRRRIERLQAKSRTLLDERNAALAEADGLKRDLAIARSRLDAERSWLQYFYGKWIEARRALPEAQEKKSTKGKCPPSTGCTICVP